MSSREALGNFIRSVTTIPLPPPSLPVIDYEVGCGDCTVCDCSSIYNTSLYDCNGVRLYYELWNYEPHVDT